MHTDKQPSAATENAAEQAPAAAPDQRNSAAAFLLAEDPELVISEMKYFCMLCGFILKDPVQTECGHRMCKACVSVLLGTESSKPCPGREEDCGLVTQASIQPDLGFYKEIQKLEVKCLYASMGCPHTCKYSQLPQHSAICLYRKTACRYRAQGCGHVNQFQKIGEHQLQCQFRPVFCTLCETSVSANQKQRHDKEECPLAEVVCPYACESTQKILRKDLENHKAACSKKPIACAYKELGCSFVGTKTDIEKHEADQPVHFPFLLKTVASLKLQKEENLKKIENLQAEILQTQIRETLLQETHAKETEKYKEKLAYLMERSIGLEARINQFEHPFSDSYKIRMAEIDLRFQLLETASYNGKMLWKIINYSSRKRDAVQGVRSLCSQPFYTSRFGYKMCARVYFNGDGVGANTHLSLFFTIMKGEYDDLLAWPFPHKIKMVLMDQSPSRNHVRDEFSPNGGTSFQKPRAPLMMNPGSGCPLFVRHEDLEDPSKHYLENDTIYIKIVVDLTHHLTT
ncbi:TNF receptor-associated factor 3 [Elysia marginata]|uniref:TNF receptor-associated factor 3 n=1 Tax=Elysia marginata TaxID=1093978 RepID=A0AAV4H1L6_9GAST|nr:TNF receptor-associated factor 3 [Elysia marginata]